METLYGTNDEEFTCTSVAEVVDKLKTEGEANVGQIYYAADFAPVEIGDFISAQWVLDEADEQGADLIGEYWDRDFLVKPEAVAELQNAIAAWTRKHTKALQYRKISGKSRELRLAESDL